MKKFRLWLLRYLLKGTPFVLVAEADLHFVHAQLRALAKNVEVQPHFSQSRSNRVYRIGQKIIGQARECAAVLSAAYTP